MEFKFRVQKSFFSQEIPFISRFVKTFFERLPRSKSLLDALSEFRAAGLSEEEIASRFDASDLAKVQEEEAHHFLVYPKGSDAIGNEILGLKKLQR